MFIERGEKNSGDEGKNWEKNLICGALLSRNCDILIKNSHREYIKYIQRKII